MTDARRFVKYVDVSLQMRNNRGPGVTVANGGAPDAFARATAVKAHRTAIETREVVAELEARWLTLDARDGMFRGLCALCGAPCKPPKRYCRAHDWAA